MRNGKTKIEIFSRKIRQTGIKTIPSTIAKTNFIFGIYFADRPEKCIGRTNANNVVKYGVLNFATIKYPSNVAIIAIKYVNTETAKK